MPEPDRHHDVGKPEITLRDLARRIAGPPCRIRRQNHGHSCATRALSVRMEHDQPIRSAITVVGIIGYAASNSRIRGSNPSATDPRGARQYLGGPSAASAAFTVLRATPITRAISEIAKSSARRNRRISAQPSTSNTCFPPARIQPGSQGSWPIFSCRAVVSFPLPSTTTTDSGCSCAAASTGTLSTPADQRPATTRSGVEPLWLGHDGNKATRNTDSAGRVGPCPSELLRARRRIGQDGDLAIRSRWSFRDV
jgi:hypothetical protein